MMTRVTVALALLSLAVPGAFAHADKVAFVDMRRAIQECAEGKVAQKKLAAELEAKQKELDEERKKLKEGGEQLAKEEKVLKPDELDKRRRALREQYYDIEKKTQAMRQELRKKEAEFVRPLRDKMLIAISQIAKREKLTHILHAESLLWTETQSMDLTNEVIRMADAAFEKAPAAKDKEQGDKKAEK